MRGARTVTPVPRSRKTSAARTTARAGVRHVVGVELDGNRAAAVLVADGEVSAVRSITAADSDAALREALEGLPAGIAVRICVVSAAQACVRLTAPSEPRSVTELPDVVAAHDRVTTAGERIPIGPGVALSAAFTAPVLPGGRWPGLVLAWPAGVVSSVYAATAAHPGPVSVVAPPMVAAPAGALVLALRETAAELTLSMGGVPVAHTALKAGGLDEVEAALGSGDEVGARRTAEALSSGGVRDPLAAGEVDRWLREALEQVVATCATWREEGLAVPDQVFIHGRGATSVSLPFLLSDTGLGRAQLPAALAKAMLKVPPAQRPQVIGAYLAAAHAVANPDPTVLGVFDDPDTSGERARQATAARRRSRTRTWARAGALLLACAGAPHVVALTHGVWADHRIDMVTADVASAVTAHLPPGQDPAVAVRGAAATMAELSARPPVADLSALPVVTAVSAPGAQVTSAVISRTAAGPTLNVHGRADNPRAVSALTAQWQAAGLHVGDVTLTADQGTSWVFVVELGS